LGHHESTETYHAIGRFIFEFSQLEYSLKHHIAEAVKLDERFIDPIMTHDFAILCTAAIEVLGESMNEERRRNLNEIINSCRTINDDRVRIAHGLWVPFREGGVVHHVQRTKLKSRRSIDQAAYLEKQSDRINQLRSEFEKLVYQI